MFKSRPGQLFYQFLRVDAFDIISIVVCMQGNVYMMPGGATVARLQFRRLRVQITSGSTILSVFPSSCL